MTNLDQIITSAQITADAWEQVVPVYVTVECTTRTGGELFFMRSKAGNWRTQQPYVQIASVLPYSYRPRQ